MKKPRLKKTPADYPQMAFRVSEEDKNRLLSLINEVHSLANSKITEDQRRVKKNELIVDALWKGLLDMKRQHRRL